MKFVFLFLFLFSFFFSNAQNNLVEIQYTRIGHFARTIESTDALYYDTNKKIAYYQLGDFRFLEEREQKENVVYIPPKPQKNLPFLYINFEENKAYYQEEPLSERYNLTETLPVMQWNITDKTKNIDGYEVTKATLTFRGRDYEAWFSYDYPYSIGPWKMHGLPGLIIELRSTSGQSQEHWVLQKLTIKKGIMPFTKKLDVIKFISIPEYLKKLREETDAYSDNLLSRLDADIELVPDTKEEQELLFKEIRKHQREIKYEWED